MRCFLRREFRARWSFCDLQAGSATILRNQSRKMTWRRQSIADCIFLTSLHHRPNSTQGQSVHNLGQTRSSQQSNHLLLTPDTFVRTALPAMKACSAIVHVSPALGARFTQYTAEFEVGGELGSTMAQRFIFVIEGRLRLEDNGKSNELSPGSYAYLPQGLHHRASAITAGRVAVIEKHYHALESANPPSLIVSSEDAISSHPLTDDPALQVKCLLPDEMSFDFAVNTMVYQPGAALSMV